MRYSRRTFLELAAASLPAVSAFGSGVTKSGASYDGVRLGVQTYSFRDMLGTPGDAIDRMIAAMQHPAQTARWVRCIASPLRKLSGVAN
jgi:hypothetical protein